MKACVNSNCIGCGLCNGICPEIFTMGDDGLAHGAEFDAALLDLVQEARDSCPVSAIDVE